jgi:ATP-dependent DNA ligase
MGRETTEWIKCKVIEDDDFVVCGRFLKGDRLPIVLGILKDSRMVYQGHATVGKNRMEYPLI